MHLIIDGDILPYSIGFAFNKEGDNLRVATVALNRRLNYIKEYIDERFKSANGSQIKKISIYMSNDEVKNFRYDVAQTQPYKENRVESEKPKFYTKLREELLKNKYSIVVSGIEADDAMGIAAARNPGKSIIVSLDKDLRMIPGWHWEMSDDRHPFFVQDPGYLSLERRAGYNQLFGTGTAWLYAQMLLGDKADNIPGLKGFGPKTTYDYLSRYNVNEYESAVRQAYKANKCGGRFEEIKELLWILRTDRNSS